jgi:hypothetical protein
MVSPLFSTQCDWYTHIARVALGTYKDSSMTPTLKRMVFALVVSKLVAFRLRRTSSMRGCIQPVRPGVLVGVFVLDPEGVAGSRLGVRPFAGRVATELERVEEVDRPA